MNGSSSRRLGRFVVAATLVATGIVVASFTPLASGGVALAAQTITTLPEPALAVGGLIDGSSCVAGPVCVMIGWNHHGNTGYLWAERWSDGKWSRLPAPPNSTFAGANAQTISCASTQWCMMTSSSAPQVGNKPIADVLDGSHWTTVPIPIVKGSTDLALYKLECQSPTWCVGVGSYVANKKNYLDATFLVSQVWNGVGWHIVPIVSPRTNAPQVDPGMVAGGDHPTASPQELSCVSKKFCVIAGFWIGVFVEQWNGHRWSEVAAPNDASRPGYDSEFSGGTCISTTDCVAVGGYAVSNGKWRPLIEKWNGQKWQIVAMPTLPKNFNAKPGFRLTGIQCASKHFCLAYGDPQFVSTRLNAMQWNGQTWRYITSGNTKLPTITCLGTGLCNMIG
jgi:hypothetical protein